MSFLVSGPRRVYVVMLYWQRVTDPCAGCHRALARLGEAIGAGDRGSAAACPVLCRLVTRIVLRRVFRQRVIGVSFFVVDAAAA